MSDELAKRLRDARHLLGELESLARWVVLYNENGHLRLGEEDIEHCKRLARETLVLRTSLDEKIVNPSIKEQDQ